MLFRPYTFPGGAFHNPVYVPYALYGRVDKIYGIEAWEQHNGFTAAQGTLNVVETVGYLLYLWVVWQYGTGGGGGAEKGVLGEALKNVGFDGAVGGGWGGIACLTGYALSIMTVSKTVLYCKSSSLHIAVLWSGSELTLRKQGSTKHFLASGILATTTRCVFFHSKFQNIYQCS